jgi:hypothetical protein
MPPLLGAIILVLPPFAPLFSHRVWLHAELLLLAAILAPVPRMVTTASWAMERRFTNYHWVLNRAIWSARHAIQMMKSLAALPRARRIWASQLLTVLCRSAEKRRLRRYKSSLDWVWQMTKQVHRWLSGRRLVLVVDSGFTAVSLAGIKSQVVMVSYLLGDVMLYHTPGASLGQTWH